MRHRLAVASLVGLIAVLVVALAPAAGAGGKPVMETITFTDTFEDEELSEACGVDVTTTLSGSITTFVFPDRPVGLQDLRTVNVDFLSMSGDNTVRFKDVGIDTVQVRPNGTVILSIVGQVPFDFTGVLKIDLETGEAILEPVHIVDTTRACRLLTR
jgi:hypothetical protein